MPELLPTKFFGFDAFSGKYVDMFESGIIDPTKVTRTALQNASSVAATLLTTESLVADKPEAKCNCSCGGGHNDANMY